MSDNGARSTDPLSVGTPRVFVDATVPLIGGKRLYADDQGVSWGDGAVPYREVTSVAYWIEKPSFGPNRTYEVRLRLRKGSMRIRFFGHTDYVRSAYEGLVTGLLVHVGRPMVIDVLNQIEAGRTVEFGGWTLNRDEAAQGRKKVPWSTPIEIRASDRYGYWWVYGTAGGKKKNIGMISIERDNGQLVRQVFQECIRRYGA